MNIVHKVARIFEKLNKNEIGRQLALRHKGTAKFSGFPIEKERTVHFSVRLAIDLNVIVAVIYNNYSMSPRWI